MNTIDFEEVRRQHPVDRVLREQFNAVIKHNKLCCPFHDDKNPSATVFTAKDGQPRFHCNVCDITYDAAQLIAHARSITIGEAVKLLGGTPVSPQPKRKEDPIGLVFDLVPIPPGTRAPMAGRKVEATTRKGKRVTYVPEDVYVYWDKDDQAQMAVLRIRKADGEKGYTQLRWCAKLNAWANVGYTDGEVPPLFNERELVTRPDAPVLLVEGEKAASQAQAVWQDWVVVTWLGGVPQASRRNFDLLNGREVTFWPDNDDQGEKAMRQALARCKPSQAWYLERFSDKPKGWDVADALQEEPAADVMAMMLAARTAHQAAPPAVPTSRTMVTQWLPQGVELFVNGKGDLDTKSEQNVVLVLKHHPQFRARAAYDVFERKVMLDGVPLTMEGALALSIELRHETGLNMPGKPLAAIVAGLALGNEVNAFSDELRALKWDGKERHLTTYAGVMPEPWAILAGRRWMIGLARRVLEPGSKHDGILVVEGSQGVGKSSLFEILGNVCGRNVYTAIDDLTGDEELAARMGGKAIYELAEMTAHRRGDQGKFKDRITRRSDRYRPLYQPDYIDMPRTGIFAGTTNELNNYLMDQTGNRRIWPVVAAGKLDRAALAADVEQLWAEAVHRALAGEPSWMQSDEEALQVGQAAMREIPDAIRDQVEQAIEEMGKGEFIRPGELWVALRVDTRSLTKKWDTKPYYDAMEKAGWKYGVHRLGGGTARGFKRVR